MGSGWLESYKVLLREFRMSVSGRQAYGFRGLRVRSGFRSL